MKPPLENTLYDLVGFNLQNLNRQVEYRVHESVPYRRGILMDAFRQGPEILVRILETTLVDIRMVELQISAVKGYKNFGEYKTL